MSKAQVLTYLDSGTSQIYVTVRAHARNAAPFPSFGVCLSFLLFLYVSTFEERVHQNRCLTEDLRRWFSMQAGEPEFTPLYVH